MIEQSELNGPVYLAQEVVEKGKNKLISKSLVINSIQFGPYQPIEIHRNPQTDMILVKYTNKNEKPYYLYDNGTLRDNINLSKNDTLDDEIFEYLYGMAKVDGYTTPYLIRNKPNVTLNIVPEINTFELPPILKGYPYEKTFEYIPEIITLLGDMQSTYCDKYKRPINAKPIKYKKYFPITIDKVTTTFAMLAPTKTHFPIVVNLVDSKDIKFACVDLEPGYTEEELQVANALDAYYVEDTPRGGKHYLVKVSSDTDVYKYRISENLEVQVNCQITFYGINGKYLNDNPDITSFDGYKEIHHTVSTITTSDIPEGISELVEECKKANDMLGTTGRDQAKRIYLTDKDESHADFTALARLYRIDIEPFKNQIPENALPWVLAEYATEVIPARVKHSDDRTGVPYLVYLADKIINRRNQM